MTTLLRRFGALSLLGLFLAGTIGLPVADAALFHLAGQDPCAGVTHVEAQGDQHHADRCTLAQPLAPQQESLGSRDAVRITPPAAAPAVVPVAALPADLAPATLQHSRAPPA